MPNFPVNYDPFSDPFMAINWICTTCNADLKIHNLKMHMSKTGHMEMLRNTYEDSLYPELTGPAWSDKSEQRKAWEVTVKKIAANIPYFNDPHKSLAVLEGAGKDRDCIVVGAGPSLQEHNHLKMLAESDFDGIVMLTDRILKPALEAGVTPDRFDIYVNTLDDKQEIGPRFYNHDIVKKWYSRIKFVCTINIDLNLTQFLDMIDATIYWYHPMRDWNNGPISFDRMFRLIAQGSGLPPMPLLSDGGNVGTCCWMIGHRVLQCKRSILLGMNLSIVGDSKYTVEEKDNIKKQNDMMNYYRSAFYHARDYYNYETINCTEGGMLSAPNIKSMKFSEYLNA